MAEKSLRTLSSNNTVRIIYLSILITNFVLGFLLQWYIAVVGHSVSDSVTHGG